MQKLSLIFLLLMLAVNTGQAEQKQAFSTHEVAKFMEPWAMTFIPDGRILLTEKRGKLFLVTQQGEISHAIYGVPDVDYRGQGGLGDVILHPNFSENSKIYLSYAEAGEGNKRGAAVASATLQFDEDGRHSLQDLAVIWRQSPKVTGAGHYGHRMAFDDEGYLFITSGERQKFHPSQDMQQNLGKVVRLHDDGSIPKDNPFYEKGGVSAEIWSLGHRNPLGIAFDQAGRLWVNEMGPKHGDELNLVKPAANYGYPIVSNGDHYNNDPIPDHDTRPEFAAPKAYWVPSIAPGGMIIYSAASFPEWQGSALIAGLRSTAIIRVKLDGESAKEAERFDMGKRIRELEQGPNGDVWVLEDGDNGRLLRLSTN